MFKNIIIIVLTLAFCFNLVYSYILTQKKKKIKSEIEEEFATQRKKEIEDEIQKQFEDKKQTLDKEYSFIEKRYKDKKRMIEREVEAAEERRDLVIGYEKEVIDSTLKDYKKLELEKINNELARRIAATKREYEEALTHAEEEYKNKSAQMAQDLDNILKTLNDYKQKQETVNQAILREKEIKEHETFYKIQLSEQDKSDLYLLKEIEAKFYNHEIFHRAAYDCYIKKPLLEMIKRVLHGKSPSGIYKITYIPTGEAYIGKSTDISKRWTEHVKSVFGIGTIAHALVHTRMARDGIWNFTWELLEEVPKDKLTEREKYWIEFYGTKEMGMNEKGG